MILMGVAPQLSKIAIKFSPLEYCALAIFSLVLVIALAGKDMIKGFESPVRLRFDVCDRWLSPIDSNEALHFRQLSILPAASSCWTLLIGLYAITEIAAAALRQSTPRI